MGGSGPTFNNMVPLAHPNPQPQRHLDRFSCFCTDDHRVSLYFTMSCPSPPSKLPFPWGIWTPSNTWFLGLLSPQPKQDLDQFSHFFAQTTAQCPYILQWDAPSPLKIVPFHGRMWTPSNTWFLGPTRVLNLNGISISSAVFAVFTSVTDLQTDRQTMLLSL